MCSSFASYSLWICLTINFESLLIFIFAIVRAIARSSPTMITLYFALLLDTRKSSHTTCSICSPMGDCNMIPTLTPDILNDPSTWKIHHCLLFSNIIHLWGNSAMKLARTCHLRECQVLYHMLYSLNSAAPFTIRSDRSRLCKVVRNDKFVNIVTQRAWKYGQSFLAALLVQGQFALLRNTLF